MKKIYLLVIALMLSVSAMRAGIPPEFSVANADGVMISYGKCESWFAQCEGYGAIVSWPEDGSKYVGPVIIPESIVHEEITYSVIGIGPYVFESTELISVGIPASVYFISSYTFYGSSNLVDIYVSWADPASVSIDGGSSFPGIDASSITLHVPVGTKAAYEGSDIWNVFNIVDDGKTAGVYSHIAGLSNLSVSAGTLSPAFSSSCYSYTVTVPLSVESITLTATPIFGGTVSGDGQKSLNIGDNNLSLEVTSADGTQQNTYEVKVLRLEQDFILELTHAFDQTGIYGFTDPITGTAVGPIKDRKYLIYRLTTGNLSGEVPLQFAAGNETLDRTVTLQPNYIYNVEVRIWIDKTGINLTTHYDAYGRPSYSEIVYPNRRTETVTVSGNGQTWNSSAMELPGAPERIEFLSLVPQGPAIGTSIAETASGKEALSIRSSAETLLLSGLQGNETLSVYSLGGSQLLRSRATGETETFSITRLPAGIYFIRIQSNERILTHKFIKN